MDNLLENVTEEVKDFVKDPRNQKVLAIAGVVYLISRSEKERNALIAGLASSVLLPKAKDQD